MTTHVSPIGPTASSSLFSIPPTGSGRISPYNSYSTSVQTRTQIITYCILLAFVIQCGLVEPLIAAAIDER